MPSELVDEVPSPIEKQASAGAEMDPGAFDFGSDDSLSLLGDAGQDDAASLGDFDDQEQGADAFPGGDDDFALGGAESFQEEMAFSWDSPAGEQPDTDVFPGENATESPAVPEMFSEPDLSVPDSLDGESAAHLPGMGGLDGEKSLKDIPPPAGCAAGPPKSRRGGSVLLLLLLVVGVAVAAGWWMWRNGMVDVNRVMVALRLAEAPVGSAVQLEPVDLQGFFVDNRKEGKFFVIQGRVRNASGEARSAIAVKGVLYDGRDRKLLQRTVFCGNPLTVSDLRGMSFAAITERMDNQFGDSLANFNVPVGKTIPFTIVFNRLPGGLASFDVKLSGSEPASR